MFWIGASNINHEQSWRWSDGEEWGFDNLRGSSGLGAVALDFRGTWHVVRSGSEDRLWYVCKKEVQWEKEERGGITVRGVAGGVFVLACLVLVLGLGAMLLWTREKTRVFRTSEMVEGFRMRFLTVGRRHSLGGGEGFQY